jgi:hypothetical protein
VDFGSFVVALAAVFVVAVFVSWGYAMLSGWRLGRYLERSHFDRWVYLTSSGSWGPGGRNPFRSLPYVFGEEDNDDPRVVVLKRAIKRGTLCTAVIIAVMLVTLVTLTIVGILTEPRGAP